MRLDPSLGATLLHLQLLGRAYFYGGRYETAAALFRERILLMPDTDASRGYLASALGHLGKFEEARQVWAELMAINPKYVDGRAAQPDRGPAEADRDGPRWRPKGRAAGLNYPFSAGRPSAACFKPSSIIDQFLRNSAFVLSS